MRSRSDPGADATGLYDSAAPRLRKGRLDRQRNRDHPTWLSRSTFHRTPGWGAFPPAADKRSGVGDGHSSRPPALILPARGEEIESRLARGFHSILSKKTRPFDFVHVPRRTPLRFRRPHADARALLTVASWAAGAGLPDPWTWSSIFRSASRPSNSARSGLRRFEQAAKSSTAFRGRSNAGVLDGDAGRDI